MSDPAGKTARALGREVKVFVCTVYGQCDLPSYPSIMLRAGPQ